jgi:UDP-glucose 4-epimerase
MNSSANQNIKRVLILGHSGFIGSHLVRHLREHLSDVEIVGEALPDIDLIRREDAEKLAPLFDAGTVVIMCAAIKRQMGDNLDTFSANVAMAANLCRLLEKRPVARFVFFSSAAVYGEEITSLKITEETAAQPTSFYGAAKFACECLFRKVIQPPASLVILRPALVYGPGDQGSYGPSGFVKAAVRGEPITLWGDGTELREFVFVEDVAQLVRRLVFHEFRGVLNIVTGKSHTFKEALDGVSQLVPLKYEVVSRPRTKPKADHAFDTARLKQFFPDFPFTGLEEGIERTVEFEKGSVSAKISGTPSKAQRR